MKSKAAGKILILTGLLFSTWMGMGVETYAADFWFDDLTGTAGTLPVGWRDDTTSPGFNAGLLHSTTGSRADITRTPAGTWGKVLSPVQTVDTATYPLVGVAVTDVSSGAFWKVGIQEEEGSYTFQDLNASAKGAGVFFFDFASAMGWTSGTHVFSVQITIEGNSGENLEIDFVRISDAVNTATTWSEDFSGPSGSTPTAWSGETGNPGFNADIRNAYEGDWAAVTIAANAVWGKVLSPRVPVLVDQFPLIGVDIKSVSFGATWKIAIQEQEGAYQHWDLRPGQRSVFWDGLFVFDYTAVTGWTSGTHTFSIELVVEGGEKRYIEVDSIKIYKDISPMPVPPAIPFADEFSQDGSPPSGWTYYPLTATTNVQMYALGGYAHLTVTAESGIITEGAISNTFTVNADAYPELWAWIWNISPLSGEYNFILHTQNVGNFPLYNSNQNTTGLKEIKYVDIIQQDSPGWGGVQNLAIEAKLKGRTGNFVTLDYIKFQPPAATPTITPTPVVNTLRPAVNLFRPQQGPLQVQYMVQSTQRIKISVFNLNGRKIRTLLDWSGSGQVSNTLDWDGRNEAGEWVGSGVYIIRLESKDLDNNTRFFKNIRVAVVR